MTAEAKPAPREAVKNYKGFVAGVFSGIAKLAGKLTQSQRLHYGNLHTQF
jgi:hypothetical protein